MPDDLLALSRYTSLRAQDERMLAWVHQEIPEDEEILVWAWGRSHVDLSAGGCLLLVPRALLVLAGQRRASVLHEGRGWTGQYHTQWVVTTERLWVVQFEYAMASATKFRVVEDRTFTRPWPVEVEERRRGWVVGMSGLPGARLLVPKGVKPTSDPYVKRTWRLGEVLGIQA